MTPAAIISGDSQPRSNDRTCEVSVVPTLAPSITDKAMERAIRPRPAKEATSRAVAVLDCSRPVMPRPPAKAVKRLREQAAMPRRSAAPKARVSPRAHHAHAPQQQGHAARTFRTVSTPCMIAESYASLAGDESFLTVL